MKVKFSLFQSFHLHLGCIPHDFQPIFKHMNKDKFTLVSWDPPGMYTHKFRILRAEFYS